MSPPSTPPATLDRRAWGALLVLCGAMFLDGLDVSMVGVALPSIDADLDLSTSSLQWIVSGYVLGYGGLLLLGGRAADLLGRRRVLIAALAVFAGASLLGGLTSDGTLLIATRFLKGIAAAFTAPAALSIITTTFPEGPARNKALAVYTATAASGFSFGLVMGGLLTTIGWRWTFLMPVPIALVLLVLAPRLIPADEPSDTAARRLYDAAGAITVTTAMLALVFTVVRAPDVGWTGWQTLTGAVAVVALLTTFVSIERRVEHPLLRLGILRTPGIVRANVAAMAMAGSYISFQFLVTLYLQQSLGWTALETALAFLPGGLLVAFGAPNMGRAIDRFGTRTLLIVGMALFTAAYALFLRADSGFGYASVLLPTMLLVGAGFAVLFPTVNVAATTGVADREQGLAGGLVNTSIQLGGAVVLAAVTAIVTGSGEAAVATDGLPDGYLAALMFVTGVSTLGLAAVGLGRRRALAPVPQPAS